jgi:hypothetical protein
MSDDIRKVQFSGGSYVMSLPVDWCRKKGIEDKTAMRVTEYPYGLLITKVEG